MASALFSRWRGYSSSPFLQISTLHCCALSSRKRSPESSKATLSSTPWMRGEVLKLAGKSTVKVAHKTSELVSKAIMEGLQPFAGRVKTLTYDNGKEFASHIQIDQALQSTGYFARPFASWERGSNENFNGLLRQYVPKKRSMNTVDEEEITMIQNRLNNRPRKRLGFKTPSEVLHQSLKRVVLRT